MSPLRTDLHRIEAWARERVRPTALERRETGRTEELLREGLRAGMSDWLLTDGRPNWSAFLPRVRALGRGAGDLGFGIGVMVQNLVTGLHLGLHVQAPGAIGVFERARRGDIIVSFAVTEPEVGAHPGKLKSKAEKLGDRWRLTGTKTFSTNGFWADEVILVAASGEEGPGKKRFVAVAVPTDAPGFAREEIRMPVCPTSTHATFRFDVEVAADRQIGEEGSAYMKIVRPFRAYEDLAGAGLFLGHLEGMEQEAGHLPSEARGRLRALVAGLERIVMAAGETLDQGGSHDAVRLAIPYLLEAAVKLVNEYPSGDPLWQARAVDIGMSSLGGNVRRRFYERLGEQE